MKFNKKLFVIVACVICFNSVSVFAGYENNLDENILPYELYDHDAVLEVTDGSFIGPQSSITGTTLFGMRATSISAGRMLNTFNSGSGSHATRAQLSSGRLGIYKEVSRGKV